MIKLYHNDKNVHTVANDHIGYGDEGGGGSGDDEDNDDDDDDEEEDYENVSGGSVVECMKLTRRLIKY